MPSGNLGEDFAGSVVRDGEVGARSPVLLAALFVMLDHPAGARSGERESFREIADHGGVRKTGGGPGRAAMVDRVIDLVADKLNPAIVGEGVEVVELGVAERRAGRIVWRVDKDELGAGVGQALDFVDVNLKIVLAAHAVE